MRPRATMSGQPAAPTVIILVDLAAMTAIGSMLAGIANRWRQPAVIGEIIAGILLGPTLLGALPGDLTSRLFPLQDRPFLTVLANIGLVLFMFVVGFDLDPAQMRKVRSAAATVALSSVALPFGLGIGTAILLYQFGGSVAGLTGHRIGIMPFVLFMGVAMSITAFPVLARILTGLEMHRSKLGTFVMTSAAGADVIAWALLALIAAIVAGGSLVRVLWLLGAMLAYTMLLAFVLRPLLRAVLLRLAGRKSNLPLLIIVVGLLMSAWITTLLGFQPIFGAFAFGMVMPREAVRAVAPEAPLLIEQASWLLVPVFFITTGLSVNLSNLGALGYLVALGIVVVASTGKFSAAAGVARLQGLDRRRATAIGVLMNTRGLTELVVIQVGITLGILTTRLASMMIIMAIVTTVAATPLFKRLYNARLQREDGHMIVQPGLAQAQQDWRDAGQTTAGHRTAGGEPV